MNRMMSILTLGCIIISPMTSFSQERTEPGIHFGNGLDVQVMGKSPAVSAEWFSQPQQTDTTGVHVGSNFGMSVTGELPSKAHDKNMDAFRDCINAESRWSACFQEDGSPIDKYPKYPKNQQTTNVNPFESVFDYRSYFPKLPFEKSVNEQLGGAL